MAAHSKLVGFKAEFPLCRALEELATTENGRSVSALLRRLAREHVKANLASLTPQARKEFERSHEVKARRMYRPSLGQY